MPIPEAADLAACSVSPRALLALHACGDGFLERVRDFPEGSAGLAGDPLQMSAVLLLDVVEGLAGLGGKLG